MHIRYRHSYGVLVVLVAVVSRAVYLAADSTVKVVRVIDGDSLVVLRDG